MLMLVLVVGEMGGQAKKDRCRTGFERRQVEAVGFERGLADRVIAEQVFARISAARAARE